jgi:hypothetical protein
MNPDELAHQRLWDSGGRALHEVRGLVETFMRDKNPSSMALPNLFLEVAELVRKLKGHRKSDGTSAEDIHRACMRIAAAAITLSLCGDADFPYEPHVVHDHKDITRF